MSELKVRSNKFALLGLVWLVALCATLSWAPMARALDAIVVDPDLDRIDVTLLGELYQNRGDRLQVETVPGPGGVAGRMVVPASTAGTDPNWMVFALRNETDQRITRWLTAQRYTAAGSKVFWPDLDAARIADVTPSLGFRPERIVNDRADIFRVTIDPGRTVTFVVELSSVQVPRLSLWKAQAYERKLQDRMLFNGILLGIVGLMAIFLTSVYAANHKAVFPAAALVAWSALAVFCIDFGFWHKLFHLSVEDYAAYRATAEAALAASFVVFLYTFLRIQLWHTWIKFACWAWILGQAGLVALAVIDPTLASGLARASFAFIGSFGTVLIGYLALRGQERALSLVPTWLLFLVWIFGAAMVVLGDLSGEVVVSAVTAGLVLLIVLLGFTVTQFAFRTGDTGPGMMPGKMALNALALEGSDLSAWEWNIRRDEISVGPDVEHALGLAPDALKNSVDAWLQQIHVSERESFRQMLWSVQEHGDGEINTEIRLRRADGSYLWYNLTARTVAATQPRSLKCVGLMRDITPEKRAHERLLHDAVHDSLTGLPNREIFVDRLSVAVTRAQSNEGIRPTVLFLDIDRFKNVNKSLGLVVGDTLLLTVARRLVKHFNPQDTLARISGDQFAMLVVSEAEPHQIAMLAERVRRSLRSPIRISGEEVILTGSIGIAVFDGQQQTHMDLLKEAEIAMFRAKSAGTDRIEIFKPSMRSEESERLPLETDLRRALERQQLNVMFQPITRLSNNSLGGFEALLRWEHPKLGLIPPDEFIPIAEETGLIGQLGLYVLNQALAHAAHWHRALPRATDPLFVSVNVSSRQLFRPDLIQQMRHVLNRETVPRGTLWLEVTESLVMENPERAIEILEVLKSFGARLSLDDFGTGYSSLSYLNRFPFDVIKVDKSLVREAGAEGAAPVVLKSVVALSHELGKMVVAEGVETETDAVYLRSIGCEFAQGFYYGEPMEQADVLVLLSALAKAEKLTPLRQRASLSGNDQQQTPQAPAQQPARPAKAVRPAPKAAPQAASQPVPQAVAQPVPQAVPSSVPQPPAANRRTESPAPAPQPKPVTSAS